MKDLNDKAGTLVRKCTCDHTYQDKKYGAQMRVFNLTGKKEKGVMARCTVCGRSN